MDIKNLLKGTSLAGKADCLAEALKDSQTRYDVENAPGRLGQLHVCEESIYTVVDVLLKAMDTKPATRSPAAKKEGE